MRLTARPMQRAPARMAAWVAVVSAGLVGYHMESAPARVVAQATPDIPGQQAGVAPDSPARSGTGLQTGQSSGHDQSTHWAYVKPASPPVSSVKNSKWPRNEIDRFILE